MSSYINTVQAMLRRDAKWGGRGPVLRGQQYMERYQQQMVILNSGCMHGALVQNSFGFMVEVENERNINNSRLNVVMPSLADMVKVTVSGATGAYTDFNGDYYATQPVAFGGEITYRQVGVEPVNKIIIGPTVKWEIIRGSDQGVMYRSTTLTIDPSTATWVNATGTGTVVSSGVTEGIPYFRRRSSVLNNVNEFICKAEETKQIVPVDYNIGNISALYWESKLETIDESHSELVLVSPTEYNDVTEDVWDENLRQFVTVTRSLTQVNSGPSTVVGATDVTHTYFEEVKCGWFVKSVEVFSKNITAYWTSENFYWPPVAELGGFSGGSNILFPVNALACVSEEGICSTKDTEITYPIKYAVDLKIKEAYNDPCKVRISTVFKATVAEGDIVNEVMIPEAISHDGIIQDFKLAPTLHVAFEVTELVSTHPTLDTPVTRTGTYTATNETDWPDTIERTFVTPMRGGYLITTKLYYKPGT